MTPSVGSVVKALTEKSALQGDQDRLEEWGNSTLIKFSMNKAKPSTWDGLTLIMALLDSMLNMTQEHAWIVMKTNGILGCINRNTASRLWEVTIPFYLTLIRPHLEYCVQSGVPSMRKTLTKGQCRATEPFRGWSACPGRARLAQPGREKAQGTHQEPTVPTGKIPEDSARLFTVTHCGGCVTSAINENKEGSN